ncbi:MAG: hypothetical protein ACFWTQ_02050 [Lactococcus sp.]|jgi:hypothetical protein
MASGLVISIKKQVHQVSEDLFFRLAKYLFDR